MKQEDRLIHTPGEHMSEYLTGRELELELAPEQGWFAYGSRTSFLLRKERR